MSEEKDGGGAVIEEVDADEEESEGGGGREKWAYGDVGCCHGLVLNVGLVWEAVDCGLEGFGFGEETVAAVVGTGRETEAAAAGDSVWGICGGGC